MEEKYKEQEKLIENHKKAIENISLGLENNLSNLDWKIKFSALEIQEDSYKELIKIISELPLGGVIIYAHEESTIMKIQENLDKAGIKIPIFKSSHDDLSKQLLEDFNEKKNSRILSAKSVKTNRDNIRAVIFYGMPKSIEKLYKETLKCGQDRKPAKSIILWRTLDPVRIQKCKLGCNKWDDLQEYMKYNQYCLEMLGKMLEYCKTNLCRRSEIRKYFKVPSLSQIHRDTCCDNCERIICERVSPCLIYKDVDSSNKINISSDARLFLRCFKDCDCNFLECKLILVGRTAKFQKTYGLKFFGSGRHKPEGYWCCIYQRLIDIGFIRMGNNKITANGNRFIRCRTRIIEMNVTENIKVYLERKKVHVILENGKTSILPIEEANYENGNQEIHKPKIFKSKCAQNSIDNVFDFEISSKSAIKNSPNKKKKNDISEKEKTPPPKNDWREAFAAVVSRRDHDDIFRQPELFLERKQYAAIETKDIKVLEPGCSHWSSSSYSSNTCSNIIKEEENVDDEHLDNMHLLRKLMQKRSVMQLDDLLDFIESYISDNNAEEVAIKKSFSDVNLEE